MARLVTRINRLRTAYLLSLKAERTQPEGKGRANQKLIVMVTCGHSQIVRFNSESDISRAGHDEPPSCNRVETL